jgi:hypothetical protein
MEHKEKLEERHYMVMVAAPELRRRVTRFGDLPPRWTI